MTNLRTVVSDTGPLITLEKLPDGYRFIQMLYDKIIVPPTVLQELVQGHFTSAEGYIAHYGISDLIEVLEVKDEKEIPELEILDKGEQEAIRLALGWKLPLLIEEEAGRVTAQRLGIKISGIAGQVLRAFKNGSIDASEAEQKLRVLYDTRRINRHLYEGLSDTIRTST